MTIAFWGSVALLLAGAMLFVLPPLLRPAASKRDVASPLEAYREQRANIDAELAAGTLTPEQHQQALAELQTRVVEEVGELPDDRAPGSATTHSTALVVAVALLIPAGALSLYGLLGQPDALRGVQAQVEGNQENAHAMSREQIEAMVENLAAKLKQNPNDPQGWHMLARSYLAFDRLPEAAQAYERANQLSPGDPQILADYADVLAMVNGRNLEGRPTELVLEALKADPKHQKSLALAGTAFFNKGEYPKAAEYWKQLLATLKPGSEQYKAIQGNIAQAESGQAPQAAARAVSPPDNAAAAGGPAIEGAVTVADGVKGSVPAGGTLFVYARGTDGSKMPLAILRSEAGAFPYRFKLDDSLAMTPQARISARSEVMLVARISKTGNAVPQPGDLTGSFGPVKVGARDVKLVIDEVIK
jgi:cytochrome c-type biogenesis protein CcmH